MRRVQALVLGVAVAGLAAACNKGPARSALAETDQELTVARPELARYLPAELARIDADVETARALLASGQYTEALRIAQKLPQRVALASEKAHARRSELTPAWSTLAGSVPASLDALAARMDEMDASRWPRGFDPAAIDAAKAELEAVQAVWARAEAAFRAEDVHDAVRLGNEARERAAALATRIATAPPSARDLVATDSARPPAAPRVRPAPATGDGGGSAAPTPATAPAASDVPAGAPAATPPPAVAPDGPPATSPPATPPSGTDTR